MYVVYMYIFTRVKTCSSSPAERDQMRQQHFAVSPMTHICRPVPGTPPTPAMSLDGEIHPPLLQPPLTFDCQPDYRGGQATSPNHFVQGSAPLFCQG